MRTLSLVTLSAVVLAVAGPRFGVMLIDGAGVDEAADAPVAAAAAAAAPAPAASSARVVIVRDGDSHFRTPALINGQSVRMLVDSGATAVVLTEADAASAGIRPAPDAYTGSARTAAGAVPVAPVSIDRLSVGGIEQHDVAAVVVRGGALPQSLLGQSFLRGVSEVRISGDRMELN